MKKRLFKDARRRGSGRRWSIPIRHGVLRPILGEGLRLALAGAVLGVLASLAGPGLLGNLLFGVSPTNPLIFAALLAALMVVALAACYLPARRAMRVDPIVALRHE